LPATTNLSGMSSDYGIELRRNGKLCYKETSLMFPELPPMPAQPNCYTSDCIKAYKKEIDVWANDCKQLADFYQLLHEYHKVRCQYCMKHKGEQINEKYILGEPAPQNISEVKEEIKKLKKLI